MSNPRSVEQATLVPGLGTYGRKISTPSNLAQKFFDQGLNLTYGYYFPEAIATFQEALRHDPQHPMIEWGLALAIGPNPNSRKNGFPDDPHGEGRKAVAAARSHLSRATPIERALVESLSVLYDIDNYPDRAVRDDKYIEATKLLVDRYPQDFEAAFMYVNALMTRGAWNYWRRDGSALPGTLEAAKTLERIMELHPLHPGAVHLYVHLFESSSEPQRALPQADLLESLMPKEGHMVHMPSHIYVRVGQYEKAIASNERSVAVDQYFLSVWRDHPFPTIGTYHTSARAHASHAWDVLRFAAVLQGNYGRALQAARAMSASHLSMNPRQQRPPAVWQVYKTFGKWDALLSEAPPASDRSYVQGVWHYIRGSAYVGRGELDKAESELASLKTSSKDPALKDVLAGANSAVSILNMLTHGLSGEIAMSRGQLSDAVNAFAEAVRLQDSLNFNEPPDWGQSMRLYLGTALLKMGRAREAERIYLEELRDFQLNGWALFGLWQSLRAQSRSAEADQIRRQFERAWRNADVVLSASVF
jgi:tetratricopeptide (TPR) repeat protein